MFGFLRKKAQVSAAPRKVLFRYETAPTRESASYWKMADDLSANGSLTPEVRRVWRNRSRNEVEHNSYARGLVLTLAEFCIGSGPRLQLLTEDESYNSQVEQEFAAWSETVGLGEKLQTLRKAKTVDGEAFAVILQNPGIRHPVNIDLRLIECDRVTTPYPSFVQKVDGIDYDRYGNPVSYNVLTEHPGDLSIWSGTSETVPAEFMIHWFRRDRPEQSRGFPELFPSLELFAQLRRYTVAVVSAAETAADIAVIIKTPDAPRDPNPNNQLIPFDSIPLEKRTATVFPDGYGMEQLKAEQPTTTYSMFKREILSEIGRCLQVPANVILGDSSNYNYASGRLDHQTFFKHIRNEQSHCEKVVLFPLFDIWYHEAVRVGLFRRFSGERISAQYARFYWDGIEHVDPIKEAKASAERIKSSISNLAIECAKSGQDWEDVLVQKAREQERMRELNLLSVPEKNTKNENEEEDDEEN